MFNEYCRSSLCIQRGWKRLPWFLCRHQRETSQYSVSHFAFVGCKSIWSQSRWNLIWHSHMPDRCQNKLRSVKNVHGKYFRTLRCLQTKEMLVATMKFRTVMLTVWFKWSLMILKNHVLTVFQNETEWMNWMKCALAGGGVQNIWASPSPPRSLSVCLSALWVAAAVARDTWMTFTSLWLT